MTHKKVDEVKYLLDTMTQEEIGEVVAYGILLAARNGLEEALNGE